MFNKKLVTSMLSVVTAASILAPCNVFAADKSYTDKGSASIPIQNDSGSSLDVKSYYTVTLPATIAGFTSADGTNYTTSFNVSVKGSITPTEEVYVIPAYKDAATGTTADAAKTDVAAEVAAMKANKYTDVHSNHTDDKISATKSYITNTKTSKNIGVTVSPEKVGFCSADRTADATTGESKLSMSGETYKVNIANTDTVTAGTYSGSVEMAWGLAESDKT